MNRENVLKVADAIANLPYGKCLDIGGKPKAFNMASGCGSACCIAGWTGEVCGEEYGILVQARKLLGLNSAQAFALFTPPGFFPMKLDGSTAAQVLRSMAAAGDKVTGKQIRAFWRDPWRKT